MDRDTVTADEARPEATAQRNDIIERRIEQHGFVRLDSAAYRILLNVCRGLARRSEK